MQALQQQQMVELTGGIDGLSDFMQACPGEGSADSAPANPI